ncbi:hypothetical protein ACO2Q3_04600 [Caulobacter sp. KR2-114]|uniref:hypothetical protein n=1 Tax=Caulobacter sp. KR2-114 TaxID=3400912 RepID=UPI003C02AC36
MIPLFLSVSVRTVHQRPIRIWLPLVLIWILLAPLLVLIVPAVMILGAIAGMNPFAAVGSFFAVFCALSGTHVEVEAPDASVFLHIT